MVNSGTLAHLSNQDEHGSIAWGVGTHVQALHGGIHTYSPAIPGGAIWARYLNVGSALLVYCLWAGSAGKRNA